VRAAVRLRATVVAHWLTADASSSSSDIFRPANAEAAQLYRDSMKEYVRRVKQTVEASWVEGDEEDDDEEDDGEADEGEGGRPMEVESASTAA
jgi:hypothetical protein